MSAPAKGLSPRQNQTLAEAERAGFDLSLVDDSLALSHTERAQQHDQALDLEAVMNLLAPVS